MSGNPSNWLIRWGSLVGLSFLLSACGRTATGSPSAPEPAPSIVQPAAPTAGWPAALPADRRGPGETLTAGGWVAPRQGYYINNDSVFSAGILAYEQSAEGPAPNSKALTLNSGESGGHSLCWASYRLLMAGRQPGVVALDVNLHGTSAKTVSTYWVGLSDYARGRWQWRGPFSDHHVRLSTAADVAAGAGYLSGLGNLFVCLVAFDGASVDVVGVSANPLDSADNEKPPAPGGLSVAAASGMLRVSWEAVTADDLAGYRIYHADHAFTEPSDEGVEVVPYLEDLPHHLLAAAGPTWLSVAAVDISGNQSALSSQVYAAPLAGDGPQTVLEVSRPTALLTEQIEMQAAGAELYDWDLDADGAYEITDDLGGSQLVDTSTTGMRRLEVLGSDGGDGLSAAGVSVLVVENTPPVAVLYVDILEGDEPLPVQLYAGASYDDDGLIVGYEWDLDGNGLFNESGAEEEARNQVLVNHTYAEAGFYNAALRVTDELGAQDTATQGIKVRGWVIHVIDPSLGEEGERAALAMVEGHPAIAWVSARHHQLRYVRAQSSTGVYFGDWDNVITIDTECWTGSNPSLAIVDGRPAIAYEDAYNYDLKYVRSLSSTGGESYEWGPPVIVDAPGWVGVDPSLAIVDGTPAISYYDLSRADLLYARSTTPVGLVASDWSQKVTVDSDGVVGTSSTLAVVDGRPAISYLDRTNNYLKYVRASTATGGLAADWSTMLTLDDSGHVLDCHSLAVVAARPMISYYTEINPRTLEPYDLMLRRSDTAGGGDPTDWEPPITAAMDGLAGSFSSLALIAGKPALSYFDSSEHVLRYARSTTANGAASGDWHLGEVADEVEYEGYATTLIEVGGSPAIAYVVTITPSASDRALKYAFLYE